MTHQLISRKNKMATSPLKAAAARRRASKGMSSAQKARFFSAAGKVTAGVKQSKTYAAAARKVALAGGGAIAAHRAGVAAHNARASRSATMASMANS